MCIFDTKGRVFCFCCERKGNIMVEGAREELVAAYGDFASELPPLKGSSEQIVQAEPIRLRMVETVLEAARDPKAVMGMFARIDDARVYIDGRSYETPAQVAEYIFRSFIELR